MLALSSGQAHAQLLDDIGETTDSLSQGELNLLPGTQERLRETVDTVTEPLRQIAPTPEPTPAPAAPPATSPAPEVPDQGIDQSSPSTSDPGASSDGAGERSSGSTDETDRTGGASADSARGEGDAGRAAGADASSSGSGPAAGRSVDGGRPGPEVDAEGAAAPLRDAIVNVIEALPAWAKAALFGLSVLLMAAVSYLILTWRRLLAAERRASTDRLTGLANRTSAEDNLGRMVALAERHERPMSIALFDLDHFKQINDAFGHQAGDAVLRAVGGAAGAQVRGSDLVARFGGEEFVLLLPDTGREGAVAVADKLRERIAALVIPEAPGGVSASFGIASHPGGPGRLSASELIASADRALYAAKDAGRNRVVVDGDAPRDDATLREALGVA